MKKIMLAGLLALAVVSAASAMDFTLQSPQVHDGGRLTNAQVFNGFGCSGENISPELNWQGEPEGTKSFALTVYDPDAPTGSGWWHWVVFNIPGDVHQLSAGIGSQPVSATAGQFDQVNTDFGKPGYGGACPPPGHGDHHYHFKVWALDTPHLDIDKQSTAAMVGFMLNQHKLATAEITALYGR